MTALAELNRARIEHIVFLGNKIPGAELRDRSRLPYPDSNEIGRLWDEGWDDD